MFVFFRVRLSVYEGAGGRVKVSGEIFKVTSSVAVLPRPSLATFQGCLHILQLCFSSLEEAKAFAFAFKTKYSLGPAKVGNVTQPELF